MHCQGGFRSGRCGLWSHGRLRGGLARFGGFGAGFSASELDSEAAGFSDSEHVLMNWATGFEVRLCTVSLLEKSLH